MKHFNYYRRRKITLFHKSNGAQLQVTMKEFNITYKELYKVINNSTMLNKALVDGVVHKKCTGGCKLFKPYNDEYFYKRSSGTFYSACKKCMGKLSRTYKIINSKDIYCKRKEYYKIYNLNNKEHIATNKAKHYFNNKTRIRDRRIMRYNKSKAAFLRRILFG